MIYGLIFVSFGDKKLLSEQNISLGIIRCILIDICSLTSLDLTSVVHKKQECLAINCLYLCFFGYKFIDAYINFELISHLYVSRYTIDEEHLRSVNSKISVISPKSSVTSNNNKGLNDKAINMLLIYCFSPNDE